MSRRVGVTLQASSKAVLGEARRTSENARKDVEWREAKAMLETRETRGEGDGEAILMRWRVSMLAKQKRSVEANGKRKRKHRGTKPEGRATARARGSDPTSRGRHTDLARQTR